MNNTNNINNPNNNIHAGHRDRMKDKYLKSGIDNFSDHELLEMLLYYALPQKNTNELAHNLIAEFGSLKGVLEADTDSLMRVDGIKKHTAILLSLVNGINRRTRISENNDCMIFDSLSKVGEYLLNYYSGLCREQVCVMLFNNSMKLIDFVKISEGSVNSAAIDYRSIATISLTKNASCVILSHNHPNGLAIPSSEDREVTKTVESALSVLGITLLEHIIVGSENYMPSMKAAFGFMRAAPSLMKFDKDFIDRFYNS